MIKERLEKIGREESKKLALTIKETEWIKENGIYIARFIASSEDGFDMDKATELSKAISNRLDEEDFIEEDYMLEVSSEGAECELTTDDDFKEAIGEYVHIDFLDDFYVTKKSKVKSLEGDLLDYSAGVITVKVNLKGRMKEFKIEKEKIEIIRKAIRF